MTRDLRWCKSFLGGLFSALTLLACAIAIHPVLEMGMLDEWSYVRSAQTLAQSGHVVYNGWATAMLGWQLLWGALFFRIFGYSFLVARISVLVLAMATIFIVHRLMVRFGINHWNATLATLTVALCPVMLSLSVSFMSDVPGMLAIVLCLYACVRATQAEGPSRQAAWIVFAALSNAIGGTARQIAWIGVLVLVPCSMWLLRRQRKVLVAGTASWITGVGIMAATLLWYRHQPYSVSEPMLRRRATLGTDLTYLPTNLLRPVLEISLLLIPILFAFFPVLWQSRRRMTYALGGTILSLLSVVGMMRLHRAQRGLMAPFLQLRGNYLSPYGLFYMWPMHYHYPVLLSHSVRLCLTLLSFFGLLSVMFTFALKQPKYAPDSIAARMRRQTQFLLVPAIVAYGVLLLPRLVVGVTLDRYLVPLLPLLLILLLNIYQQRVQRFLPWQTFGFLIVMGLYGVAVAHDSFALYRGVLAATDEIRAAGVPRDQIDGGWEYDALTQLDEGVYIHQPGVRTPDKGPLNLSTTANACPIEYLIMMPAVQAHYALSFDPNVCAGPVGFPPVTYRRWIGQHTVTIYIVGDPVVPGLPFADSRGLTASGYLPWRWNSMKVP